MSVEASARSDLGADLRDGYEVHAAALRRGLDVVLYPRQVLIASHDQTELAFVHGVPETSSLGPVTYAQDKRMRRALLERAEIPIPKGTTFSVGRGVDGAKRFAERIGYPVVVKPAIGDNAIETFADLQNEEQFDAAVDRLRVPPSERETFTRAAYGLTELREPGEDEEGRLVVPPGYRFLVEDHVYGQYVRFLILYGQVHSTIHCPGSPSLEYTRPNRDMGDDVHSTLRQLAVDALDVLPGITVGAVDIVLTDHQRPAEEQDLWVVEISERPGLAVQAAISDELSAEYGDAIVAGLAEDRGLRLEGSADTVTVDWQAEAIPDVENAEVSLNDFCRAQGLTADITVRDAVEGILGGVLEGPSTQIARMSELLLAGKIDGHRAMLAEAAHV